MSLQILGIHHLVLTVSDPKKSARFYEKILGVHQDFANEKVVCIPCGSFYLCLQRPSHQALPEDRFDENRLGLDHIGFAVESHQQLDALLRVLEELNVSTAGIEYDKDGKSDYVCFRDPDNIQVEFYIGEYHD
jgi:catechol 2,3-dioxygenase-like lactoylglutathione lyase family enzyme